jgi:hypothetical protein
VLSVSLCFVFFVSFPPFSSALTLRPLRLCVIFFLLSLRPATTSQPTPNTRPTPAQSEAALAIARNLFPERPNTGPTQSETPAAVATLSTNPATPTQTVQPAHLEPTPSEPPTQPRQQGVPTRDPYAVHFDHNYRLIVDGKPW